MKIHFDFAISLDITEKRLLKLGFRPMRNIGKCYVIGRTMNDAGNFYNTVVLDLDEMKIYAEHGNQFPDHSEMKVRSMRDVKQFLAKHDHKDHEAEHLKKYPKRDTIDVWLRHCGGSKVAVIMEVRSILSMDLQLARKLVDQAPVLIKACKTIPEAEDIKHRLEAKGAEIILK